MFSEKHSNYNTDTVCKQQNRKLMKNSGLFLNMAKGCFFFVCFFFQALMSLCFLSGKVARVLKMRAFPVLGALWGGFVFFIWVWKVWLFSCFLFLLFFLVLVLFLFACFVLFCGWMDVVVSVSVFVLFVCFFVFVFFFFFCFCFFLVVVVVFCFVFWSV